MRVTGSRDELVEELKLLAVGWDHLGKPKNAVASLRGSFALAGGASSVRVGHTTYEVTEGAAGGTLTESARQRAGSD